MLEFELSPPTLQVYVTGHERNKNMFVFMVCIVQLTNT